MTTPTQKRIESDFYVEGFASTFDRYHLFDCKDGPVYEQVDRNAFDNANMSDVVMLYDHKGDVLARTGNGTLGLEVTDSGLFVYADLSKTARSREVFESIQSGLITQMSFGFEPKSMDFDPDSMTQRIHSIKRVRDVSAVSFPANEYTRIDARSIEALLDKKRGTDAQRIGLKAKALRLKGEILNGHN